MNTPRAPPNPAPPIRPPRTNFRIWQQNVNCSLPASNTLLNTIFPSFTDVIALQEPYWDSVKNTRSRSCWYVVYPPGYKLENNRARSVMLVSTKISSNTWEQLDVPSLDISAILITFPSNSMRLAIFNVYLDQHHSETLRILDEATRKIQAEDRTHRRKTEIIWLGDFNRHSPLWDEARNHHLFTRRNLEAAEQLSRAVANRGLSMLLPPGIPTLQAFSSKNETRPDNVFGSEAIQDRLIRCQTHPHDTPPHTDHYPILTELDQRPETAPTKERYNYSQVDWEEIYEALEPRLKEHGPPKELVTLEALKTEFKRVTTHLEDVIRELVPLSKPAPIRNRWWTKELTALRKEHLRLQRMSKRHRWNPDHDAHGASRQVGKQLVEAIRKAKEDCWYKWHDDMGELVYADEIWKVNKLYIGGAGKDPCSTRVPTMKSEGPEGIPDVADNETKSRLFQEAFFLPPPNPLPVLLDSYPPLFFAGQVLLTIR